MQISIALHKTADSHSYDVDMQVSQTALYNRETLRGVFRDFDKTLGQWQEMAGAAKSGTAIATVQDRRYKLTEVDSEGNFVVEAD